MSSNLNDTFDKKPFVCYFCNKTIHCETELGHTAVCSSVLLPCPNECGVYTRRCDAKEHGKKCPNDIRRKNRQCVQNYEQPCSNQFPSLVSVQDVNPLGLENSPSSVVQEIKTLQNRCGILEHRLNNFINYYDKIKTPIDSKEVESFLRDRLSEEWKDIVDMKLKDIRQQLIQQELSKSEAREHWNKLRQYLFVFEKFKIEVNNLTEMLKNERVMRKQMHAEIEQKFNTLQSCIGTKNVELNSTFNEYNEKIEKSNSTYENLKKSLDDLKTKFVTLNFDVKALTRIATEATEKLEIQQKETKMIEKNLIQLKIDQEILEEKTISSNIPIGRFLWRIINVNSRLERAKENGIVLRSPIFYTHEFGYKIQVHLYLNGLNKWKDRYALICFHVVKSEYDMTLKWPCSIEGTVTLKDIQNTENPKNYSKFITAKRQEPGEENEDPHESSSTYIFIPHTILMKSNFMRDNTIFLDIAIKRNQKLTQETE